MKQPTRILILGGGYVAIIACRALRKAINRGEVEVTVVSKENYHIWHGYVSEMITGRIAAGQILSPARGGYAGTELAGELADYVRLLTRRAYKRIRREECRVVLVQSGPHSLPLPRGDRGRVVTEPSMRVVGYENVWAGGDCAAVPHVSGGVCPPVGTYAMQMGTHIGKNILRQLGGQALRPFAWPGLGQVVSIGRRTAVGGIRGVQFKGLLCWLMWRAISYYYFPSWDRKLRLLADWLIWPLVGRYICLVTEGSLEGAMAAGEQ